MLILNLQTTNKFYPHGLGALYIICVLCIVWEMVICSFKFLFIIYILQTLTDLILWQNLLLNTFGDINQLIRTNNVFYMYKCFLLTNKT